MLDYSQKLGCARVRQLTLGYYVDGVDGYSDTVNAQGGIDGNSDGDASKRGGGSAAWASAGEQVCKAVPSGVWADV